MEQNNMRVVPSAQKGPNPYYQVPLVTFRSGYEVARMPNENEN